MTVKLQLPYDHDDLKANLAKAGLIAASSEIELAAYSTGYARRNDSRRWHYKISSAERVICHLIVGKGLSTIHKKSVDFFAACPQLVCRPLLFWQNGQGLDLLALEHVSGSSLDSMVERGDCKGERWMNFVRQAQTSLEQTRQPSNKIALEHELLALVNNISALPGVSSLDLAILRETAMPAVLEGALSEKLSTRWSNGDFCGRNLLVDAHDCIRLIDYEFSSQTHFSRTDWLRLKHFSILPSDLDQDSTQEIDEAPRPWDEIWFWLHQLSLLADAEPSDTLNHHLNDTISQAFSAIAKITRSKTGGTPASLLISSLTAKQDESRVLLKDRTVWATSLENELRQALATLAQQNKLAEERLEWVRAVQKELEAAKNDFADRTIWSQSLAKELETTKNDFEKLSREFAERTTWALSLERDLGTAVAEHQLSVLDTQRDMITKDAESGNLAGLVLEAQLRVQVNETEINRLQSALVDAQIHVDHLLNQTKELNLRIESATNSRQNSEMILLQREKELAASIHELRKTQVALNEYQNNWISRLACRFPITKTNSQRKP